MTDILERLTDYIAQRPSANGRTFHEMDEEVLIAQSADEIVKLRTALREIACDGEDCHCQAPQYCSYGIARLALGEKKDG
jgi:hypothetical protein